MEINFLISNHMEPKKIYIMNVGILLLLRSTLVLIVSLYTKITALQKTILNPPVMNSVSFIIFSCKLLYIDNIRQKSANK